MNTLNNISNTGPYYCSNLINTPDGRSKFGYINVYNQGSSAGWAIYREYNSNVLYINMKYLSTWQGWSLVNPDYSKTLNWQKYKLTNDDGTLTSVSGLDLSSTTVLNSLKPGMYYGNNFINAPVPAGFLEVVSRADNTIKRIELKPYNTKDTYVMTYTNSTWSSWQLMNAQPTFSDTGWLPLVLSNGVQPYSTGYTPQYKLVNNNGDVTLKFKGAVKNITTSGVAIATLPSNIASQVTMNSAFVQNSSVKSGNATIARWSVTTSGDLRLDGVSFQIV